MSLNPPDAAKEMRKRGVDDWIKKTNEGHSVVDQIQRGSPWQRVREPGTPSKLTQRARGKLQEFRRQRKHLRDRGGKAVYRASFSNDLKKNKDML